MNRDAFFRRHWQGCRTHRVELVIDHPATAIDPETRGAAAAEGMTLGDVIGLFIGAGWRKGENPDIRANRPYIIR